MMLVRDAWTRAEVEEAGEQVSAVSTRYTCQWPLLHRCAWPWDAQWSHPPRATR